MSPHPSTVGPRQAWFSVGESQKWVWEEAWGSRYLMAASTTASTSKPYEIVERARGWDVDHDGVSYGVKGSETEEEGEVDADDGISGVPLSCCTRAKPAISLSRR
jgi:hypothetical protein